MAECAHRRVATGSWGTASEWAGGYQNDVALWVMRASPVGEWWARQRQCGVWSGCGWLRLPAPALVYLGLGGTAGPRGCRARGGGGGGGPLPPHWAGSSDHFLPGRPTGSLGGRGAKAKPGRGEPHAAQLWR